MPDLPDYTEKGCPVGLTKEESRSVKVAKKRRRFAKRRQKMTQTKREKKLEKGKEEKGESERAPSFHRTSSVLADAPKGPAHLPGQSRVSTTTLRSRLDIDLIGRYNLFRRLQLLSTRCQ